ncbi:MAG: CoA-binding protein [Zetaproteobacteria bacterium CG2_30_46_52]|nr:MAG: CoA-binding protein [Zetaproteobacteria bacterium CG2_30_46_52]
MSLNPSDEEIKTILSSAKTIAVVGCSPKPDRTSHKITAYLISQGYEVFPIHPQADVILGQAVYKSLDDIPVSVDLVNVFRKPEFTPPIAQAAADIGAKTLWLQLGISNDEARHIAEENDMHCVMDACILVKHQSLI